MTDYSSLFRLLPYLPELIVLCLVFLAVLIPMAIREGKKTAKKFYEDLGAVKSEGGYVIETGGRKIRLLFQGTNNGTWLSLATPAPVPVSIEITGRSDVDDLTEAWGLERRCPTGDPAFDYRMHTACDDPAFCAAFLDEKRRRALTALGDAGFKSVVWDGRDVIAKWGALDMRKDAPRLRRDLALLAELADHLPSSPAKALAPAQSESYTFRWSSLPVLAAPIASALAYLNWNPPVHLLGMALYSLSVGVPLAGITFAWTLRGLEGRSWKRGALLELCVGCLLLLVVAYQGCCVANSVFDRSPGTEFTLNVLGENFESHSGWPSYSVITDSWERSRQEERIPVNAAEFKAALPDKTQVRLRVKPGALGFSWISSLKVEPRPALPRALPPDLTAEQTARLNWDDRSAEEKSRGKDYLGAASVLADAERIEPQDPIWHMRRAIALLYAHDAGDSISEWTAAEPLIGDDYKLQFTRSLGVAVAERVANYLPEARSDYADAMEYAKHLQDGGKSEAEATMGFASCLAASGNVAAALETYRKAEKDTTDPGTLKKIAAGIARLQRRGYNEPQK